MDLFRVFVKVVTYNSRPLPKKADFEPDPSLKPDNSHIFPHTNFNRLPLLEKKMSESSDLTHLI